MRFRAIINSVRKAVYQTAFYAERLIEEPNVRTASLGTRSFGKICLVKQDVYNDLYCCPRNAAPAEVIFSSLKRSGPVSLITELGAEFRIVETDDSPECSVWQQKWTDCGQKPLSHYYGLRENSNPFGENQHTVGQGAYAENARAIDWSRYDLVISLDVAVPKDVTRANPETVWCYWISEPCMGEYKRSHLRPTPGYDFFFNQRFWQTNAIGGGFHEVDFPYMLQRVGCYRQIISSKPRRGIVVESHSKNELDPTQLAALEAFGPVSFIEGSVRDILEKLHGAKYWVRLGGRFLWGNGMAEAIACGCLALANPTEFKNRSLFGDNSAVYGFEELLKRLAHFEADQGEFSRELADQQDRLAYYCFRRPLAALADKIGDVKRSRGKAV